MNRNQDRYDLNQDASRLNQAGKTGPGQGRQLNHAASHGPQAILQTRLFIPMGVAP